MDIAIKLLLFVVGVLFGALVAAIFASAGRRGLEDQIDIMRSCSSKQDEAIRQKQNRIDELERDARKEKRK